MGIERSFFPLREGEDEGDFMLSFGFKKDLCKSPNIMSRF